MSAFLTFGVMGLLSVYLPALRGPDTPERAAALDYMVARGEAGIEPLGEALERVGWRAREGILDMLVRIGPGSLPVLMRTARTHPRVDARRLAIRSVGQVGGSAARDSLLRLLDTAERDLVLEALGEIGDPAAVSEVARFAADDRADVRRRAVVALGKIAGAGAVDRIADALSDDNHGVRFAAAGVLETMGDAAARTLMVRIEVLSGAACYLAVRTLGRLRYRPAAGVLERALRSDDWSVRAAAAEALGQMGGRGFDGALEDALQEETHPFVRERIRFSLQMLDTR